MIGWLMTVRSIGLTIVSVMAVFAAIEHPKAQDFYKDKTINLIVGFSPGGTYDQTARTLARHIGDHIPGKPSVVVQTMTGAGGFTSVVNLYNVAPRDGTVIGMPPRNFPLAPYTNDQLRYDGRGFNPIGSTTTEVQVCAIWYGANVETFDELMTHEITSGITSYYDDIGSLTLVTKNVTGAKLKIVSGYPGGNDISSAMEKGEVDAECGWSWGSIKTRALAWLNQKKIRVVFQIGSEKSEELAGVPFIMDYAKTDLDRKALELLMAPDAFAWPFVAPPGVPADRVAILRRAFDETMKDSAFLAEAKQAKLEINPMTGESMQAKIDHILGFDSSVVSRAKEMVKPPN